ncbi:MAG: mannose-1-phosphate guanylyltransferase [Saprospiraceae bacterium]|nr:mannose-1-phosphate guanylyltransferase [Saprospiraceae bacterium]
MNFIAIMAGGVGSRFWPASRESLPKQFLDILGIGKSLLRLTYERSLNLVPNENILIVTNAKYRELVMEHLPELPVENILCEPSRNNTAPCVAYTALRVESMDQDGVMAILPSDHVIMKEKEFEVRINEAFKFAKENKALITLGIQPTRPDTGYGYIELGENGSDDIFEVRSFREKPELEKARAYVDDGGYVWNAGIFIWSVESILDAFKKNASQIYEVLTRNRSVYGTFNEQSYIDLNYPETEKISVDYAIMERAENVYCLPADIGWSDLGTWTSLHALLDKNDHGTVLLGEGDTGSSRDSLIRSHSSEKLIVAEGLDNFIVIDEKDVLLIWPKDREQEIKQLRERIDQRYDGKYS